MTVLFRIYLLEFYIQINYYFWNTILLILTFSVECFKYESCLGVG